MDGPDKPFVNIDHSGRGQGFGIQPLGPSPLGGDVHDGFNWDGDGNVSGGHTTVRIPGGQSIKMPWEPK